MLEVNATTQPTELNQSLNIQNIKNLNFNPFGNDSTHMKTYTAYINHKKPY